MRDEEHAVSTVMLGPAKLKNHETRFERHDDSVPVA